MSLLHRLLHGHWPRWEAVDYDFLTWRYRCTRCVRFRDTGWPHLHGSDKYFEPPEGSDDE